MILITRTPKKKGPYSETPIKIQGRGLGRLADSAEGARFNFQPRMQSTWELAKVSVAQYSQNGPCCFVHGVYIGYIMSRYMGVGLN